MKYILYSKTKIIRWVGFVWVFLVWLLCWLLVSNENCNCSPSKNFFFFLTVEILYDFERSRMRIIWDWSVKDNDLDKQEGECWAEVRSANEGCEKGTVLYGQGQGSRLRSWRRESLCPFLSRKFIDCLVGTRVLTLHSTCELGIDKSLGVRKIILTLPQFPYL